MTVKELINRLSKIDRDAEVMILDGFNGGGYPRTINLGPVPHVLQIEDSENCVDCEGRWGEKIYIIGYGCY